MIKKHLFLSTLCIGVLAFGINSYSNTLHKNQVERKYSNKWHLEKDKWYYINDDGSKATGWILDNGRWYYLNKDGVMATNWIMDNNKWYYLNKDGAMATGWIEDKGNWYYLHQDGYMLYDTITKDGYRLELSGKSQKHGVNFNPNYRSSYKYSTIKDTVNKVEDELNQKNKKDKEQGEISQDESKKQGQDEVNPGENESQGQGETNQGENDSQGQGETNQGESQSQGKGEENQDESKKQGQDEVNQGDSQSQGKDEVSPGENQSQGQGETNQGESQDLSKGQENQDNNQSQGQDETNQSPTDEKKEEDTQKPDEDDTVKEEKKAPEVVLSNTEKNIITNTVTLTYQMTDVDNAHTKTNVKLYKKSDLTTVIAEKDITNYVNNENVVVFDNLANNENYVIKTTVFYDEDKSVELSEVVEFIFEKKLELKDVDYVTLYKDNVKVDLIKPLDENATGYTLKIFTKQGSEILLNVKEISSYDNNTKYKVITTTNELVSNKKGIYEDDATFYIDKPIIGENIYNDFASLVAAIKANPDGDFILGNDLDASGQELDNTEFAYIATTFTGNLIGSTDGKTFKIKNLTAPLFKTIDNAIIRDIEFTDVNINTNNLDVATIAVHTNNATRIENVTVKADITAPRYMGGMVYKAHQHTIFNNVKFIGSITSTQKNDNRVGAIAAMLFDNSKIENAVVDVTIDVIADGGSHKVGGIVGELKGSSKLNNSVVKGTIQNKGNVTGQVGGVVGSIENSAKVDNVLAMINVVNGRKFHGDTGYNRPHITNSYYVDAKSSGADDVFVDNPNKVGTLSIEEAKTKLAENNLDINIDDEDVQTVDSYEEIKDYDANKSVLYQNIEKFIPFHSKEFIVKLANQLNDETISEYELNTKKIVSVTPFMQTQNQNLEVVYDFANNKENLNKILVYYGDGTHRYLDVEYMNKRFNSFEEYKIKDKNLLYTPKLFTDNLSTEVESLRSAFNSLDYMNIIKTLYPNYEYSWGQKIGYANQVLGNKNKQDEASDILKSQNVDPYSLKASFEEVKAGLDKYLFRLLENSSDLDFTNKTQLNKKIEYIKENKDKILLSLAYMNRWYNFNIGELNVRDITLFNQSIFGNDANAIEDLIKIADIPTNSSTKNYLFGEHTPKVYAKVFANTKNTDIWNYVNTLYGLADINEDITQWFVDTSKAVIVEYPFVKSENDVVEEKIFNLLQRDTYQKYVLSLLTLKKPSIAILSSPTLFSISPVNNYFNVEEYINTNKEDELISKTKDILNQLGRAQNLNMEFWYRMMNQDQKDKFLSYRIFPIFTTDNMINHRGKWVIPFNKNELSEQRDDYADMGVSEFMVPLGNYMYPNGIGAVANGSTIQFVGYKLLNKDGWQILTHEVTHNLDNFYIGGFGRRDDFHAEYFARSLFETIADITRDDNLGLNYNIDYEVFEGGKYKDNRQANKSPERFKVQEDLHTFFSGEFDVLTTMSIAEAEVLMNMPKEDLQKIVVKVEKDPNATPNTGYEKNDIYVPFTDEQLNNITFNSIDDFIDNNVVRTDLLNNEQRFEAQKQHQAFARLYDSFYGSYTSESKYVGDMLGKRNAYFLLAEGGYEAFSNYMSNRFYNETKANNIPLSDKYILSKTFGDGTTFNTLYKRAYHKRLDKKEQLKPFVYDGKTYDEDVYNNMKNLIDEALKADLVKIKSNDNRKYRFDNLRKVKDAIFKYYLNTTDDFRESIYTN